MDCKTEKCNCGNNEWSLIAHIYECLTCHERFIMHKNSNKNHKCFNPLDNVYTRREYIDGSKEELNAIELERKNEENKLYRKQPNCC